MRLRVNLALRILTFRLRNRIALIFAVLTAVVVASGISLSYLTPWLATALALGAILVPGWLALRMIAPEPPFSTEATLPIAFCLGVGLLSPFALIVVWLHMPLSMLGYLVVVFTIGLGSFAWFKQAHPDMRSPISQRVKLKPIVLFTLVPLMAIGAVFYLFLSTLSTWGSGDLWYLRYINAYTTGAYESVDFNLRASWWILQAWQNQITGINSLDAFSFYLPPFLMLLSLLSFYALAQKLFKQRGSALMALLVHLLFLVSSINSHDWLGRGFFDRIIEDKFLIWLIMLPVALLLALRYIETGQWRLLWGLGPVYMALVLVHPLGLVQGTLVIGSFGLVHLLVERKLKVLGRVCVMCGLLALLVVVPLVQRNGIISIDKQPQKTTTIDVESKNSSPTYAGGIKNVPARLYLNENRLWVFSAIDDTYIAHPFLIAHPMSLLAVLLTPLLLFDLRRSLVAQLLFSNMVATLVLLYTPWLTSILGRVITPWMIYRLSYGLPVTLVLAYFLQKGSSNLLTARWPRQRRFAALWPVAAVSLLFLLMAGYIVEGISFLKERREQTLGTAERDILAHLADNVGSNDVIIAEDDNMTYFIPASVTSGTLYDNAGYDPKAREAVTHFYRTEWITPATLQLLRQWNISTMVVDHQTNLSFYLAQLPAHFTPIYHNPQYTLYQFNASIKSTEILVASSQLLEGKTEQALQQYNQILRDNPTNVLAYLGVGEAFRQMSKPAEAEAAWRQALLLDSGFNPAAQKLSSLLANQGQIPAAIDILQEALKHAPTPVLHQQLGDLYLTAGKTETAQSHYKQAIAATPNNSSYHLTLADLYAQRGLFDQALVEYNTVIAIDTWPTFGFNPEHLSGVHQSFDFRQQRLIQAHMGLAGLYWQTDQLGKAENAYRRAIAITTNYQPAYTELASFYHTQEATEKVPSLYSQAARLNHNAAWPHVELGKLFMKQATGSEK
ncbi:MAG: tetratricopeptide repeat protein [Anaerolineae bacterium]|nr:tetratricopeptide repeat protein [Anaerolineae bacterium]